MYSTRFTSCYFSAFINCRDTQAAIKAENSMATFGEISKIVASMWDSLSEEAKQVRIWAY